MDISVVIPTYNRREGLRRCLEALFDQDYPEGGLEVIVVDDGSTDKTLDMLRDLSKTKTFLRWFTQPHRGPAAARNFGLSQAAADIVGFTDDDCVLSSDWVEKMVRAHRLYPEATAVGGTTVVPSGSVKLAVSQFLSDGAIQTAIGGQTEVIFFPTCNVSLKKKLLDKDVFDESFPLPAGEDLEFFWRLFCKGRRFVARADIFVTHDRDPSLAGFLRQAYSYGRGNFLVRCLYSNHPLLKELKEGGVAFWFATLLNFIKIPRFSGVLGKKLIGKRSDLGGWRAGPVYFYFALHKAAYLFGNIAEHRARRSGILSPRIFSDGLLQTFILDITHTCNLSCRICDIWETGSREKDLDIVLVKKALKEARDLHVPEIALSGGEPLLRRDISEIFEFARQIGIRDLGVLTNGLLIKDRMAFLMPYLLDETISLVVSLDSLRPDVHNLIRSNERAWEGTCAGLKELSALKVRYPQVHFSVITIVLDRNLEELGDIARYVRSLGADSIQFQPLLPNNLRMAQRKDSPFWIRGERQVLLDAKIEELVVFGENEPGFIRNSAVNLRLMKKYYRGGISSGDVRCSSAGKTVLLANQGVFTTCFSRYGDVATQTLAEVLRSEDIRKARRQLAQCSWPCLLPCFCDR
jgi:glycosyltransferase involved in cell wall biosynthesis/MoaA/NifB/PqqE/SkfB family radical SAM enzyme